MADLQFTPGPWAVYQGDPIIIVNSDGSSLGEMSAGDPFISHAEMMANTQLASAAPQLLEALIDLISWFDGGPSPHGPWIIKAGEYGADDAVEAARAAITRATGAQS